MLRIRMDPDGSGPASQRWTQPREGADGEGSDSDPERSRVLVEHALHFILRANPLVVLGKIRVVVDAEGTGVRFRRRNPLRFRQSKVAERNLGQLDAPRAVGEVHDCTHLVVAAPAADVVHLCVMCQGDLSHLVEIVRHVVSRLVRTGSQGQAPSKHDPDDHEQPGWTARKHEPTSRQRRLLLRSSHADTLAASSRGINPLPDELQALSCRAARP